MTSRRGFLAGLAASSLGAGATWAELGDPVALSACKRPDGSYRLVGLSDTGALLFSTPLPARGHAAAAHPNLAEAVAFARRPGTFAKVIDCASGVARQTLNAPEGRHFYGHGAFSADGAVLFTTENDIATGQGRIGVWDRGLAYQRIDEFGSGGIGPHEILRRPSGDLAVANGGIHTHPDSGRDKLNLPTMRPNLSVLSTSGVLLDQAEPPRAEHQNSLRHIAAAPDGCVACGFQWQGDPYDAPSLVGTYTGDGTLEASDIDLSLQYRLDGYIGSVCVFGPNAQIAATSPRGGQVMVFDRAGGLHHRQSIADVCGVAPLPDGRALATDGSGRVYAWNGHRFDLIARHDLAFDNHLVALATLAAA